VVNLVDGDVTYACNCLAGSSASSQPNRSSKVVSAFSSLNEWRRRRRPPDRAVQCRSSISCCCGSRLCGACFNGGRLDEGQPTLAAGSNGGGLTAGGYAQGPGWLDVEDDDHRAAAVGTLAH
jgi:hypothetical protein